MAVSNKRGNVRTGRRTTAVHLRLERCESRTVPTLTVAPYYAVGSGPGMAATIKVYMNDGTFVTSFHPFTNTPNPTDYFQGGTDVAVADINGDGVADVIAGAGPGGGPHVKVFNGVDIMAGSTNPSIIKEFYAFPAAFRGGVNVATGDVDGDGLIDIVCGTGATNNINNPQVPQVIVYSNGDSTNQLMNFFPYSTSFRGNVDVACGDIGGDGTSDEVVTGAGPGGSPIVGVYNYLSNGDPTQNLEKIAEFPAYNASLSCGVNVACGYTSNNRDASNFLYADIITGAGAGGGPDVKVFRLLDAHYDAQGHPANWTFFQAGDVFPYNPNYIGGVRVGVVRNGMYDDILTGPESNDGVIIPGSTINGGPDFRIYNQTSIGDLVTYTPTQRLNQFPFDQILVNGHLVDFLGGIYVS